MLDNSGRNCTDPIANLAKEPVEI
jgi:hypothetical protein